MKNQSIYKTYVRPVKDFFENIFSVDIKSGLDAVPRHIDDKSETWEPKIFFECNPMLNTECPKTNCWINNILNPQGCCSRTTNYRYSDTGLVLWPDTSLGQPTGLLSSPTCRHCPLEPAKCRDFQAAQGVRPCNVFSTYSAFMLRK